MIFFVYINVDKQYNAIYDARHNPLKIVHIYLKALRALKLKQHKIRAALVCVRQTWDTPSPAGEVLTV
jgi:hypothetical protein